MAAAGFTTSRPLTKNAFATRSVGVRYFLAWSIKPQSFTEPNPGGCLLKIECPGTTSSRATICQLPGRRAPDFLFALRQGRTLPAGQCIDAQSPAGKPSTKAGLRQQERLTLDESAKGVGQTVAVSQLRAADVGIPAILSVSSTFVDWHPSGAPVGRAPMDARRRRQTHNPNLAI